MSVSRDIVNVGGFLQILKYSALMHSLEYGDLRCFTFSFLFFLSSFFLFNCRGHKWINIPDNFFQAVVFLLRPRPAGPTKCWWSQRTQRLQDPNHKNQLLLLLKSCCSLISTLTHKLLVWTFLLRSVCQIFFFSFEYYCSSECFYCLYYSIGCFTRHGSSLSTFWIKWKLKTSCQSFFISIHGLAKYNVLIVLYNLI